MSVIEIKDLSKSYDGRRNAVDHISLSAQEGKISALLGPNGAGKTTTIKILMGLLHFEQGDVLIDNHSIKEEYPISVKEIIGYVPDENTLYGYLTGYQYLRFICGMYRINYKKNLDEIEEYVQLFQLQRYMNQLIHTYSKGTVQKLMIMSEMIHRPKIMIMDEPFSALDPEMIAVTLDLIRKQADEGRTFIISSHIINLVERICDDYAIIREGAVLADGDMRQMKPGKSLEDTYFESISRIKDQSNK